MARASTRHTDEPSHCSGKLILNQIGYKRCSTFNKAID